MRIAICDDNIIEFENMKKLLKEYSASKNIVLDMVTFNSPLELINQIQKGVSYDLLILDIIMPLLNGIDTAKEIREYDKNIKILFLTFSSEFALDSYSVNAYNYLIKPVSGNKIFPILDSVLLEIKKNSTEYLLVRSSSGLMRIYIDSLVYCEIRNKTILYFLSNARIVESCGSIKNLEMSLHVFPRFIKFHRSFIVNMDYIISLNKAEVFLVGEAKIPIPRGKYNTVKNSFLNYSFNISDGVKF